MTQAKTRRPRLAAHENQGDGYSLVELLVVLGIVLLLAALVVPYLMSARRAAQEAAAVAFLRSLHVAQEQHRIMTSEYGANFSDLEDLRMHLASNRPRFSPEQVLALHLRRSPIEGLPNVALWLTPMPDVQESPHDGTYNSNAPARPDDRRRDGGCEGCMRQERPDGDTLPPGNQHSPDNHSPDSDLPPSGASPSDTRSDSDSNQPGDFVPGSAAPHVDEEVSRNVLQWQGYEFALERLTPDSWRCTARPLRNQADGLHYFTNQSGVIRRQSGQPANETSAPI